ncbi:unnamed protein product [Anisakis simplex]|uniref:Alpha/beta hydrolase2 (inferred by orthology to a D. melanogaster protein) n=1 Tax=Anisakis simplex TaxID=6269 RepID=A0A0M3JRJ5_ANISI|nr:unnamed protein product [Anisakis simplex]
MSVYTIPSQFRRELELVSKNAEMDVASFSSMLSSPVNLSEMWPNPSWLIMVFVFIAVLRILKVFSFPEKPEVIYVDKSSEKHQAVGEVLAKCSILNEIYNPPLLWGRNGHFQTAAYGLIGHASLGRTFDSRRIIKLPDGSSVIVDIFEPVVSHSTGKDYTLALCPGIANSSESNYIRTCVHYAQQNGYRCVVLNHLGALSDINLTSSRIFSYGGIEELNAMMLHISELYPNTRFISVGFSMGANITSRFLHYADQNLLDKIVIGLSVCQGYCAKTSASINLDWENGRRAYNYVITENMKRLLRRNYDMAVAPFSKARLIDEQVGYLHLNVKVVHKCAEKNISGVQRCTVSFSERLWCATSILAFDESYSRRVFGYSSLASFYEECSCLPLLHKITVPMVFVNALDDPLIPKQLWEPVKELVQGNPQFGFVLTKHGGHLGFLEGASVAPNSVTWLDRFIVQLSNAAVDIYES